MIILMSRGIGGLTAGHAGTSEGIAYIENAESEDIAAIEEKISRLEEQDGTSGQDRSLKERFSQAVILGDSVASGFSEYNILNASSVVADTGAGLERYDGLVERTKELHPRIVFLALGTNDIAAADGDIDQFIEKYGGFPGTL